MIIVASLRLQLVVVHLVALLRVSLTVESIRLILLERDGENRGLVDVIDVGGMGDLGEHRVLGVQGFCRLVGCQRLHSLDGIGV